MIGFEEKWKAIRQELAEGAKDAFWLLHHASYLMRTGGELWLVDPVLSADEHALADEQLAGVLGEVKAIFITHLHGDHYDPRFLKAMRETGAQVIMPDFLTDEQRKAAEECAGSVRYVSPVETVEIGGLQASAFVSLHRDMYGGELHGLDEYGFRVVTAGRIFLFPGDVRSYDKAPPLEYADELFAHVWLGRRSALNFTQTDVDAFCRYFAASKARRIWLAHLYDFGREPSDMWTEEHACLVREGLRVYLPHTEICIPGHGDMNLL